jgi:acetyl-CoA carboxylase beta subunit
MVIYSGTSVMNVSDAKTFESLEETLELKTSLEFKTSEEYYEYKIAFAMLDAKRNSKVAAEAAEKAKKEAAIARFLGRV